MSRPLLPPRGIFASTRLLFDRRLSGSLKETTLQLMALAWGNSEYRTPTLSLAQLAELTNKQVRTLRGQLNLLDRMEGVLRLQRPAPGMLTVTLASWLFRNDAPITGDNLPPRQSPDAGDRQTSDAGDRQTSDAGDRQTSDAGVRQTPGEQPAAAGRKAQAAAGRKTRRAALQAARPAAVQPAGNLGKAKSGRAKVRLLSKNLRDELIERGLFPSLLPEVAASSYSEADLRALLAWCCVDSADCPAALFMGRLRAGANAPAVYRGTPCAVCGQYGKHASDCRRRYAQDIYHNG